MRIPEVTETFEGDGFVFMFTSINRTTEEGTVKFFENKETAEKYYHNISLSQFPDWHKQNCGYCKDDGVFYQPFKDKP